MQLTKPTFSLFAEDFELMKAKLSSDEIVAIFSALSDLCLWGECEYTPQTPKQEYFWDKLKTKFEYDLSSYRASVENGKKGGRPKKETQNITQTETQNITQDITQKKPSCHLSLVTNTLDDREKDTLKGIQKEKNKIFQKPSLEEVQAYCRERNNGVDAEKFYDFYESKGWFVGKNKMKDWRAAVRTWERGSFAAAGRKAVAARPSDEELAAWEWKPDNPDAETDWDFWRKMNKGEVSHV